MITGQRVIYQGAAIGRGKVVAWLMSGSRAIAIIECDDGRFRQRGLDLLKLVPERVARKSLLGSDKPPQYPDDD